MASRSPIHNFCRYLTPPRLIELLPMPPERNVNERCVSPARRRILARTCSIVSTTLAVIHFTWRVKKDLREPIAYDLVLSGLLLMRLVRPGRRAMPSLPNPTDVTA